MSDQFDSIKNTAKAVGSEVSRVAGEVVNISKNKWQEFKLKGELSETYERLGNVIYDCAKNKIDNPDLVAMIINEIDGIKEKLADLRTEPEAEKATELYCPKCGHTNAVDSLFCCQCGAALSEDK